MLYLHHLYCSGAKPLYKVIKTIHVVNDKNFFPEPLITVSL